MDQITTRLTNPSKRVTRAEKEAFVAATRRRRRPNRTKAQIAYTARQKREARARRSAKHTAQDHAWGKVRRKPRRRKNPRRSTRKGQVRKTARRAYEPRTKNPKIAGIDLTEATVNALGVMVGGAGASTVAGALDDAIVQQVPAGARTLAYAALTIGVVWGAMYAQKRATGMVKTALPYLAGAIGGSLGNATYQSLRSTLGMAGTMGRSRRRGGWRGTIDAGEPIGFMNGDYRRAWGPPPSQSSRSWAGTIDSGQPIGLMQGTVHRQGSSLPVGRGFMRATL